METNKAIALWKELGITNASMEFSCGGDSMSDYQFNFYTDGEQSKKVKSSELDSFFDDEVFRKVEFYVNSDGHYIGEFGTVEIVLEEDDEDFSYYKSAQSEWSESFSDTVVVELTEKEVEFVRTKVFSLVGGEDGNLINYKGDCIINDDEEQISDTLLVKVYDKVVNHEFEDANGEQGDWFQFDTNEVDSDVLPKIVGNKLYISVTSQFMVLTDSEC